MRKSVVLRSSLGLLLWAVASACFAAPDTFASAVLGDNPIAYWRFGEAPGASTAVDSAVGHDGTYSTTGIILGTPGIGGGDTGALFDGVSGRVTVPNDPALGPNHISMEALVRWDGPNTLQQRILEKSFFEGGQQASYNLSILNDGKVQVEVRSGGLATSHTTTQALAAGQEAYLVGTFNGTSVSIYLDGALVHSGAAAAGDLQDGLNALGIGNQSERDRPFLGLIDEVALYDYALSAGDIGLHYTALTIPEPATYGLLLAGLGLLGFAARRQSGRTGNA